MAPLLESWWAVTAPTEAVREVTLCDFRAQVMKSNEASNLLVRILALSPELSH